ncbi:TetM/TetW/TetO/TetS family tetracycline resistance ribosomal protection protein [[Ruminococcus] lactaris]|uniref:translation factor GTPase family protein n=1 Tax=[Ruminococcus] lactaris TaxID=46228 RepID=UPI001D055056|nr:TetM/TetW/TetO/TetS family tetracycline resistance ribosomal protection protein [[Ruminococcus] lactaris]MCB5812679.1 TetM/TetW/TetO/TetS family tetracycline resistance ribosomal protection protein [[Ruminococcus] lactaris]MCB5819937.1 TetM/TetW/TetO/TetS family tetracycline resistance ribosomal protection protein [[Ruminococcus] lactaris]MCB5834064.1 TetM/TetW/TetO/TetS family tetracycline resistance ribosomal protection protein [[Ruminococcus] lactaris]MCB5849075.1 TetM/TetW/TetO/TetS fami
MSGQERKTGKRVLNVGLLAHVDAGKTTLSESILYQSGAIRNLGRVDHQDAFLDTDEMERERGITIFSKQAVLTWKDTEITLLDTPGHVDFSAEMERVLQVLDCAVLVISGADGVQGHTETLWKLLTRYGIPVFLFVNKMDQEGTDCGKLLAELKSRFSEGCIDFGRVETGAEEVIEEIAVCDEQTMEEYLEKGSVAAASIRRLVAERKIFPCYFGSALHLQGVEELMNGICTYQMQKEYPAVFGAKVYKIARDGQGNRLTYLKVTGGTLKVKDVIGENGDKVNQIRVYSGEKYELLSEADAGKVCAVTGLAETYPGQGLGAEKDSELPILEPVLTYRIILPDDCNVHTMLRDLKLLEEEEPELHVVWIEKSQEIHVQLMGDVQIEILQRIIKERFGVLVEFGEGSIVYKETIAAPVEGVGHFEPLRHYAEVHLRLEPGERGSGMQFDSECSEDVLDRNWQRLVLTHLEEKEHKGVLTGSVITDMKITLTSGKAHLKHTEGGDFRQATYRAVRQGLKKAESVLLEPYYEFRIELPSENVGRAMTDIQNRFGKFEAPETLGEMTVLTGIAPVSTLSGYQKDVIAYTGGRGRISLTLKGYDLCHNQEEVVAARGYDSELDLANPTGSVFCAHGAGFVVDWDEVEEYMHMERTLDQTGEEGLAEVTLPKRRHSSIELTQEELDAIYVRTPDPVKQNHGPVTVCAKEKDREPGSAYTDPKWERRRREKEGRQEYLLVDGYNIIFSWKELRELSEKDIGAARGKLADILSNYQGYRKCTLILVYDAYKVEGNPGEVMKYHNIYIVYTKEAETADQYIEKTVRRIAKDAAVTVATSDGLEQVIILGQGANRMSAPGLKEEIERTLAEVRGEHLGKKGSVGNYLFDYLDEETAEEMEKVRLGKAGKNGRDKK